MFKLNNQPAFSLLPLTPVLSVFSFFNRFRAVLLSVEKFCTALPLDFKRLLSAITDKNIISFVPSWQKTNHS